VIFALNTKELTQVTPIIPQRLRGLLRPDGRCLIVALDHALAHGPIRGLDDPGAAIETMLDHGADAIMTSYGIVKKYGHLVGGRAPLIMRLDGGPSLVTATWREYDDFRLMVEVEDAARLGASAVVLMYFMGAPVEMDTLETLAAVAAECERIQMPLIVEALPCPHPKIPNIFDPEMIAIASRIAAEYGADLVKTTYSGSAESFRRVTATATVPVVVLGGERMDNTRDVFELVHGALAAGACGIAMGRNIWQASDPAAMLRALGALVHGDASVDAALALVK
jgi:fructose-bisphosphate aldolase, class I